MYIPSIRHESPHNKWDFLRPQLLNCNLQRIRLSLQIHQNGRIHRDLQRPGTQNSSPLVLGHVRRSSPFLVWNLLVLDLQLSTLGSCDGVGVAREDNTVLASCVQLVWVLGRVGAAHLSVLIVASVWLWLLWVVLWLVVVVGWGASVLLCQL